MKYSVGYQLDADGKYADYIVQNKAFICEVYFSWLGIANGRGRGLENSQLYPWDAQSRQIKELRLFHESGIKLNLLLNAACYGEKSQSRSFFCEIGSVIEYLLEASSIHSVTTTSPIIAKFIHENFPGIEIRASVNMSIGSIQGMDYLSGYFDGFYMKREYNRDFQRIAALKEWCCENDKHLYCLANSGCLNNCSAHTFHDSLVAHESEIAKMDNAYEFTGICREYLRDRKKCVSLLCDSNFIRPEDILLYKEYFGVMKLATRISQNPYRIIKAYIDEKYSGNILDLLEPNNSDVLYPYIIENSRIPACFAKKSSDKNFCREVFENALVNLEG